MKNKNKFEEDDFQEINYNEGFFSKRVKKNIKGKGKLIKRYDKISCIDNKFCECQHCLGKNDFEFTKIFNYIHSEALFNYSFILTEYKKHSKILNYKNFNNFFIDENKFDIKLIYRASENNYSIKYNNYLKKGFMCFFTFYEIKYYDAYFIESKLINDGVSIKFVIGYKFQKIRI